MLYKNLKAGNNAPEDINVVIEIPMNSDPIKYEVDKDSGIIFVDRFIQTPMYYPANYGFIPNTLADDKDPLDVLVLTRFSLIPGCVINAVPVGVLIMEDEKGMDEKIIAVPHYKCDPLYSKIKNISDISDILKSQIKHFFERYKDLEAGKWVKVKEFESVERAKEIIKASIV